LSSNYVRPKRIDKTRLQASAPVYGSELEAHLKRSGSKIALPLRTCVCRLLQLDVCEEGLFRVAAPTLKIRRLASLLDTGDCSDEQVKSNHGSRGDSNPQSSFKKG
jgi:hypothetical protein